VDKFRDLEPQYNGQLFNEHRLSEKLILDDALLRRFIESLYYPKTQYQFNKVGVELLGTIYERFLGSTIRLLPKRGAVVEEKPEVRKAGGVYYTPAYIVDYIVENTVGKLLGKCKTPRDVVKLKILDPACGSGSFLLGAFRRLIEWHEDYYNKHPEKISKPPKAECWLDKEHRDGPRYRLTARAKGRILVNNIYGVDIDPQAVEVTVMSLYLKVLEDVDAGLLMKTALLPPLDGNIKCGNSLIGSDYWDFVWAEQGELFERTDEEERRVNPFDWDQEFGDIIKYKPGSRDLAEGYGFDAVIGNPPWGSKEVLNTDEIKYFTVSYGVESKNLNIFVLFIISSYVRWCKLEGRVGLLIPKNFIKTYGYLPIRKDLVENKYIETVTDFGQFPGVAQEAISVEITKATKGIEKVNRYSYYAEKKEDLTPIGYEYITSGNEYIISLTLDENAEEIFKKVDKKSVTIGDICTVGRGLEHGRNGDIIFCRSCELWSEKPGKGKEADIYYICPHCSNEISSANVVERKFIYRISSDVPDTIKTSPLLIGANIDSYNLKGFEYVIEEDVPGINYKIDLHKKPKLLFIRISKFLRGYLDYNDIYALNALNIVTSKPGGTYDLHYILGILNSSLLKSYFEQRYTAGANLTIRITNRVLKSLPIRTINFSDPADVEKHDRMVQLVDEILDLHKRLAAAKSDADKTRLERAVKATDRKIDALVYEMYGLTEDEIAVVEGAA
jgi:hypothetical protein